MAICVHVCIFGGGYVPTNLLNLPRLVIYNTQRLCNTFFCKFNLKYNCPMHMYLYMCSTRKHALFVIYISADTFLEIMIQVLRIGSMHISFAIYSKQCGTRCPTLVEVMLCIIQALANVSHSFDLGHCCNPGHSVLLKNQVMICLQGYHPGSPLCLGGHSWYSRIKKGQIRDSCILRD